MLGGASAKVAVIIREVDCPLLAKGIVGAFEVIDDL